MGWFKRKIKEADPSVDVVAGRIAQRILRFQQRIADSLNAKAKKWNLKVLVIVFLGAGLIFAGYCLWLVLGLFR